MGDELVADVVALAGAIARVCVARITATKERVPASSLRALSELVELLDVAAHGDRASAADGSLVSPADVAVDLSQRRSVREGALFDALGAAAYAADAALLWETSRSSAKHEQSCANLARAARGASSIAAIAPSVMQAIGRIDVRLRVLREALPSVVLASFEAMRAAHASEHLLGYALCTDDSLTTLSASGCTGESLARSRAPAARWLPAEWSHIDSGEGFAFVRDLLEASYQARGREGFDAHIERAFAVCIESLGELRTRRRVGEDVLLVVVSTDPGPPFVEWAIAGATTLNTPELAEGFRRAVGE
jgi:hypothetical protein